MCVWLGYEDREWQLLTQAQIKDAVGNEYARAKDVAGEKRMAFTSLADSAFDVCFENILYSSMPSQTPRSPRP